MTAVVRLETVQIRPVPSTLLHPVHPPNVPLGTAVICTVEPLAKPLLVQVPAELAQLNPEGELEIVPVPVPKKFTVMLAPEPPPPPPPPPPDPVSQMTLPVM